MYSQNRDAIDLVMLDMVMPKLNGKETFLRLLEINPDVRVLFCSGFNREGTASELAQLGAKGYVRKPYSMAALGQAVADALSA
jgi:DNA-binding NarL/FixJ family response regulator